MTFCASKTVNGMTTNHIWDGSNIVAETDGNKQVTAKYYRGSGLINQEVSNTESYYQFNMHGDVIGLTGANGELIEDYDYDAFGNQINQSTEKSTPFRYNGEYYDEETGFTYLRARYYDPTTGRFIQEDPIKDGSNWYTYACDIIGTKTFFGIFVPNETQAYCAGNPVNLVDPSGFSPAITIDETDDSVKITVYVKINMDFQSNRVSEYWAYRTVKDGMGESWSTTENENYRGKDVSIEIVDVANLTNPDPKQNYINVVVKDRFGISNMTYSGDWDPDTNPGEITMYVGDIRSLPGYANAQIGQEVAVGTTNMDALYSYQDLKDTAGHELGHALGVEDLYDNMDVINAGYDPNANTSIFNSQWGGLGAQTKDYDIVIRANKKKRWQKWKSNLDLLDPNTKMSK